MDPLTLAVASAFVGAVTTDGWQQARSGVVGLWRRMRPDQAEEIDGDVLRTRSELVQAAERDDTETGPATVGQWRLAFERLLREDPAAREALAGLLDQELRPLLTAEQDRQVTSITMNARAEGRAQIFQAGRDMNRPS